MILVEAVMNTSSELDIFKSTEYARKFFYVSKIVCTESLPDSKTVKKIAAYLC